MIEQRSVDRHDELIKHCEERLREVKGEGARRFLADHLRGMKWQRELEVKLLARGALSGGSESCKARARRMRKEHRERDAGKLVLAPYPIKKSNAWVRKHHRHHPPVQGCVFSIAAWLFPKGKPPIGKLVGVAIVGRPCRMLQDGFTLEVTRLCSDGTFNACSKLLAGVTRAAQAIGVRRMVSYTLPEEGGAAWRAAGWIFDGEGGGGEWDRPSRPRRAASNPQVKHRWLWFAPGVDRESYGRIRVEEPQLQEAIANGNPGE